MRPIPTVIAAASLVLTLAAAPVQSALADSCAVTVEPAQFDPVAGERWWIGYTGNDAVTGIAVTVQYYWTSAAGQGAWTSAVLETSFPAGSREELSYGYTHGPVGDFHVVAADCR